MTVFNDTLVQGIGMSQSGPVDVTGQATDAIGVTYRLIDVRAQPATASDVVNVTPALAPSYGMVVLEQLRIALAQVPNHKFQLLLADVVAAAEQLTPAWSTTIAEGVGVNLAGSAQLAISVIEQLGLLPAVAGAALYGRTVAETIGIAETLAAFFGASLSDGIGVAETLLGSAAYPAVVSEGVGIEQDELTPQLVIRATAADSINITPELAVNWLMSDLLEDGIEITAAYLSPGDSVTTWVINTRSGAVSEYTNYAFNSFAKIGNRYIGGSADGLYELLGDDDDGDPIIPRLKSGFLQWGGSKFTMFKAVYLAVRGGGNFVLKIETADGKSYSYAVAARDMRTTKINIGKGIRTSYFAFELIGDGTDFDMDRLEFVPIATDRRI